MRKGQETRAAIVAAALEQAARTGLEGLTIGALAERMRMSKSGVFSHFGSREELQIAVLKAYGDAFVDTVLRPAMREPRGLPRLLAMLDRWIAHTMVQADSGCLWISSATDYDDRPGAVRDDLVATLRGWKEEITRAITLSMNAGHLLAGTDTNDLVFDLHGTILALHHDARLMRSPDSAARSHRSIARALEPWLTPAGRAVLTQFATSAKTLDAASETLRSQSTPQSVPESTPVAAEGSGTASKPSAQPAPRGRRHAPVHAPAP